jgi:5-methylcytosine-specific restriction endonuclease McrA
MSGKRKQKAFDFIAARDGLSCSVCAVGHRAIWRRMGLWSGDQWGDDAWERFRYTKVNRSSNLEVEHTIPLSEGGGNDYRNLRLMCCDCHKAKTSAERSARLKRLFAEART